MRNLFRVPCILSLFVGTLAAQKIVVAGTRNVRQCDYAVRPLLADLRVVAFPHDWTIVLACTPAVWSYFQARADARGTNTAFTNLRGRVTVVNAAIYSEPLPLQGTTHRTPRIVLEHERGHILCRCVDEHKADEFPSAEIMGGFMESQPVAIRTTTSVDNGHVQEVVRWAHEELRQLLQQRAEVTRQIGTIKQTIAGLASLFGDGVLNDELLELMGRRTNSPQPGFTEACRMILMDANHALSARDICDRIQEKLPPMLERHKDPMASLRTVLNRLVAYGEARAVALENGRRAWKWIADSEPESMPC